jgi:hypothetical protein
MAVQRRRAGVVFPSARGAYAKVICNPSQRVPDLHNGWLGTPTNLLLLLGLGACQHVDEINTDGLTLDDGEPPSTADDDHAGIGPMVPPMPAPASSQKMVVRYVPPSQPEPAPPPQETETPPVVPVPDMPERLPPPPPPPPPKDGEGETKNPGQPRVPKAPESGDIRQYDTTSHKIPATPDDSPNIQPAVQGRYDIAAPGDWSAHDKGVAIIGGVSWDPASTAPAHGSIVHLSTGGSERKPQEVQLGAGVDHVIYGIGFGARPDGWQPFDGIQIVENFDIGVDKLWFSHGQPDQGWRHDLRGLETRVHEGTIAYVTADASPENGDAHDSVLAVVITGPRLSGVSVVAHKIELRFHQPDDQRRAFEILSQKSSDFVQGRIETFAQIMGDSLGFITSWDDLGLGDQLPATDQLPEII